MTYEALLQKWKNSNITQQYLYDVFLVRYIYNTNKLENINLTYNQTKEVFENETIQNYAGDVRELFSVLNSQNTFKFLYVASQHKIPLSIDLIKKTHKIAMRNSLDKHRYEAKHERCGEFKKHDYVVGKYDTGVSPECVESSLKELLELISQNSLKDPLKLATVFHCEFECIHPFSDGNGRVGRWLFNYILMLFNYPLVIIYDEDKQVYYDLLEEYDITQDPKNLYDFFKQQSLKTWKIDKTRKVINFKETKEFLE